MKVFLLIIWLCISTGAIAQRSPAQELRIEDFKSLRLSTEQRNRIATLIRQERLQHWKNMQELDKILTEEQKKKLARWRNTGKAPGDSTSNPKNQSHD